MKKLNLVIIFVMAASFMFGGIIRKTYRISSPQINYRNEFSSITFDNAMLTGQAGCPALPYFAVNILLPPGEVATSIKFVGSNEIDIVGKLTLFPYQTSKPLSDPFASELQYNTDVYNSKRNYPVVQTGGLSTEYLHGHSIAISTFTPLIYIPSENKVSYYQTVEVIIETSVSEKASNALDNLSTSSKSGKKILGLVHNPENINLYLPARNRTGDSYKLLIITPNQYVNSFASLQNVYLSRGIDSQVATTEDIANNSSGQDLQEKIRNYIIQEYQDSDIEYVLLGGDVEYIPHRGFYCYVQSGNGYTSNDIPADLYYSALDGNWNDDGDNKWGEPDEDDLLPEIAIARFPFSNEQELARMIHKSVSYQNNPVLGELTNALLAGENLYMNPDTWGRDYLDLIIGEHSDNGYTTIGIPETYPIDSLYEHDGPWDGTALMNEINEGKQFVHHVGHANTSYVAHLNTSDITNANFYGANGIDHNYTLFQTHGCDCGSFDNSDCIMEKMVTIDNFAVSVIGNSRYGWFNEGQTEGPSAHLHREMVDAMYNEQMNHLGSAFVECKLQTASWVEAPGQYEEGALRWNFYDINILGDPALSVWTAEPITIAVDYEEEIELGTSTTEVMVTSGGIPMENFTCSIVKDGVLLATEETDVVGNAILNFDPVVSEVGQAFLIVVGYNCLPDTSIITFIASSEAYVVYNSHTVFDPTGNNNGICDYGETILLDLAVYNVGATTAMNVISTLIVDDIYITISDNNEQYGNIAPGDTTMAEGAFTFEISPIIPDQRVITFNLICESEGQTWESEFEIIVCAPIPNIGNLLVDDVSGGNGNGKLDPGETAKLFIDLTNSGQSDCGGSIVGLSTTNPYLSISPESVDIDTLVTGESTSVEFNVVLDEAIPYGTVVTFTCDLNMCEYLDNKIFYNTIGLFIEDFETGDFTAFDWQLEGDNGWVISNNNPYNGVFCSKSGGINDNEESHLIITIDVLQDDEISFARKVSSEVDYDFLRFYIDDFKIDEWSGDRSWGVVTYELPIGQHSLLWSYEKDINTTGGNDCSWVDDIIFPPMATITDIQVITSNNDLLVYPNPGNGHFSLSINSNVNKAKVNVYNTLGELVENFESNFTNGQANINLQYINPGLYIIEVVTGSGSMFRKIVSN